MKSIYVAKKNWSNASAFITMNNGEISVHGKFMDGCRNYPGPEVNNLMHVPGDLAKEIVQRQNWDAPMSSELEAFCMEVWKKAQQECGWFKD